MARTFIMQSPEVKYSVFSRPTVSLEHQLAIYGRQSTKEQVINNKGAYVQQTVKLVKIGKEIGFKEENEDIILFIENKGKNGKWVNASGRLRIDQRPHLQSLTEYISRDEVKTVLVWSIDRLFRDEDMIQPPVFVKLCKEHHCVILTVDDFFDFNNPKRDDRKRFLELAQAAADFLTKHIKKMEDARNELARKGEYNGRGLGLGLYIPEDEKKPYVHSHLAPYVRWLFKRHRQLQNFNILCNEIAAKEALIPFPPDGVKLPLMRISKVSKGYTVTRTGLVNILTNPAYIGYWYFQEKDRATILIKDNHEKLIDGESVDLDGDVVTEEDFWYSFNTLSPTTIEGEPIVREKRPRQLQTHKSKKSITFQALLDDVITAPKNPVYVFYKDMKTRHEPVYTIANTWKGLAAENDVSTSYYGSVRVRILDAVFLERFNFRLRYFEGVDTLLGKLEPNQVKQREKRIVERLQAIQKQTIVSNNNIEKQIEEIKPEITSLDRTLRFGSADLDITDIQRYARRLKSLRTSLQELEKIKDKGERTNSSLQEIAENIVSASGRFEKLSFERQKYAVSLLVERVVIEQIAEGWMQVDIHWTPYMGFTFIDRAYIFQSRGTGEKWSDEEKEVLRESYTTLTKYELLQMFPSRTWGALYCQASLMGIHRPNKQQDNRQIPLWMSYQDKEVIEKYRIDLGEYLRYRPQRYHDWHMLSVQKNESSS